MLEYFTYQKFKKAKAKKAAQEAIAASDTEANSTLISEIGTGTAQAMAIDAKGKGKAQAAAADSEAGTCEIPEITTENGDQNQEQAKSSVPTLVLRKDDENFFRSIIDWDSLLSKSDDDAASRPPLPPRPSAGSSKEKGPNSEAKDHDTKGKDKPDNETEDKNKEQPGPGRLNRLSAFFRRDQTKTKASSPAPSGEHLAVLAETGTAETDPVAITPAEAQSEAKELAHVLNELNLSAKNNRAFSMSAESAALVQKFSLVLQDLINGVPTAVDDMKALVEDRDGTLARSYDRLPSPLKKLVASMPTKVTDSLGPELAAAAAKSQGVTLEAAAEGAAGKTVAKEAAKKIFTSVSLTELLTNPAAIVDMLKAIMSALKLRWPAFIGTNAVMSVGLFLLLFVLWYCHKRGREVRLEKEEAARADVQAEAVDIGSDTAEQDAVDKTAILADKNEGEQTDAPVDAVPIASVDQAAGPDAAAQKPTSETLAFPAKDTESTPP
ncbi:hypothetical protein BROUX41_006601 [Berkeleyomyces rouxiae]